MRKQRLVQQQMSNASRGSTSKFEARGGCRERRKDQEGVAARVTTRRVRIDRSGMYCRQELDSRTFGLILHKIKKLKMLYEVQGSVRQQERKALTPHDRDMAQGDGTNAAKEAHQAMRTHGVCRKYGGCIIQRRVSWRDETLHGHASASVFASTPYPYQYPAYHSLQL